MDYHKILPVIFLTCFIFFLYCNNSGKRGEKKLISDPDKMDQQSGNEIKVLLESAGKIDDSIHLQYASSVNRFYTGNKYDPVWSHKEKWQPQADSLFQFIQNSALYGLFPEDYHFRYLQSLKNKLDNDSLSRMDATLWSKADIIFTDGFMHIVKDLKWGRLAPDSVLLKKSGALAGHFLDSNLESMLQKKQFTALLNAAEPKHKGYWELKRGIKPFLDSMDRRIYTYVTYPYKANNEKDSLLFITLLKKRLDESGCIDPVNKLPDSTQLKTAIIKYQKKKGLQQDGKITTALIKSMNTTDAERFKRIAITLDRYKQLPDTMPEKFIWVNLPAYYLQVWDHDTVVFESKIICGKPATQTPLLSGVITDMVTFPTWTVPASIITKQYLPKLKTNSNYLSKLGLRLINHKGETIDASSINWSKYSKGIPYKVVQSSGDDNALGILKFNFDNPYFIYLHDTNQRYLFKNAKRALSHGCVRVQEWEKLAFYIARNDSMNVKKGDSLRYTVDSIKNWLTRKVRKKIDVKNGIQLFIRYFSCEGKDGKIKFYDDIYADDKLLREKYFNDK